MFMKVTRNHAHLKYRNIAMFMSISIMLPIIGTLMMRRFTYPQIEIWKISSYVISTICLAQFSNLKGLVYRALKKTITELDKHLKHDLQERHVSAEKIREYKILWIQWSHLVSQEYYMLGILYGYSILLMLFTIIITLYSVLVEFQNIQHDWMRVMSAVFPCTVFCITLYSVCNAAHQLRIMGVQIKEELQLTLPINVSPQVMQEVKSFLTAIEMNPPVISVMGFANVDRELFRALISTTVTYMIVLIQFGKGNSNKNCTNVTNTADRIG